MIEIPHLEKIRNKQEIFLLMFYTILTIALTGKNLYSESYGLLTVDKQIYELYDNI